MPSRLDMNLVLQNVHDVATETLGVRVKTAGAVSEIVSRYLDTNGDGTGTKDAQGDYSGAVTPFFIAPPAGSIFRISRLLVQIKDSGGMDSGFYGNAITLTNGILVRKSNGSGVITDYTDGLPILTNGDWGRVCYDVQEIQWGSGDTYVAVRWTLSKSGKPIRLVGNDGEFFEVVLNDDLRALNGHYFMIQGYVES